MMADFAIATPVLPGKKEEWLAFSREMEGSHRADLAAFAKSAGVDHIRAWLQSTPQGDMAVVVHEGPRAHDWLKVVASSDDPTAEWLRGMLKSVHGIDPASGETPPSVEPVFDISFN
jgi:hypothetical protein